LKVEPVGVIALEAAHGAPERLDPEAIALTGDGHILISSEGIGSEEPRLPPALIEYTPEGRFIRQLTVRPRFAPDPYGPQTSGVRGNAGFESLTTSPDFDRLFTGAELPLVQDGDGDAFVSGSRSRILEYVRRSGRYEPAGEFAYELDRLEKPSFEPIFAVNGLVELLAISRLELLAMERGYAESAGRAASMSRIRIFRITLAGATDISARETLRGATDVVPVRKTLLLDLDALPGLSPALRSLDNFEGLAWGPALPEGRRNLIVVSDDNFNEHQVTAFLFLRPGIE
jgi:glycerophosphoryl diester phosphodiesterase